MNKQTPTHIGLPGLALALTTLLVLLATVYRGGNRAAPLMGLEWLALALLLACALPWLGRGSLPAGWGSGRWAALRLGLAGAPLVVALVQLLPWPGVGTLSATPEATAYALLASLPLAAAWLVGLGANPAQLQTILRLWVGVAVAQALLGLLQLGGSEALQFGFVTAEKVKGTYASKNTYANLMAMALPLAVWLLLNALKKNQDHRSGGLGLAPWGWGLVVFALLAAVLASRSRTGIATAMLVSLLALTLLPVSSQRHPGSGSRRLGPWLAAGGVALLLLALVASGLDWTDRFDADLLARDDEMRAVSRAATWQAALAHLPWGAGLGSFSGVFPAWQAQEVGRYLIDLAHSDFLQIFMETGLLGLAAMAMVLALLGRRVLQLLGSARGRWSNADRLAVACGLGLLATLLHAWVDYPLRVPANAMLASFLLGVFLREPASAEPTNGARRRGHISNEM